MNITKQDELNFKVFRMYCNKRTIKKGKTSCEVHKATCVVGSCPHFEFGVNQK